ncbi:MAG: VWA domain-containing protein [Deltaproteobacteria bacterium]|nr:VWA domain-containing protein [Deltaproteobacteria bacterium]
MSKVPTSSETSVQVTVLWGDRILRVEERRPPCSFWLGVVPGNPGCCFFPLPAELLGAPARQLVAAEGPDAVRLTLLPGAAGTVALPGEPPRAIAPAEDAEAVAAPTLPLPTGAVAEQRLGSVTVRVAVGRAEPRLGSRRRSPRARATAACLSLSTLLHLGLGLGGCWSPPPPVGDDGLTDEQREIVRHYLSAAEEQELEAREAETRGEDKGDAREGGAGTRAKGEQGSMGRDDGSLASAERRYGVVGPSDAADPHVARSPGMRDAAEFGMIGLLSVGAGGGGALAASSMGFGTGHGRLGPAHPLGRPVAEPAPVLPFIDRNGRFATTYRPGRGHLAAFDAAVARGALPEAARELVANVGAPYAPALAPAEDKALAFAVEAERSALPPDGGPVNLRFALRSTPLSGGGRPQLSVHLVLDASGSMAGEPMAQAKEAAHELVARLAPTDQFSLTAFSTEGSLRLRTGPVGPRRAYIRQVIDALETGGTTNIYDGLRLAYQQAEQGRVEGDAAKVVLVLSDGQANTGVTDREALAAMALEAFQSGIETSSFGLGAAYDGRLMSAIAADGAGGYYYLRDAEQIGPALTAEIEQRLDPAATAVEIRVRLADEVGLLHVYGSRRLGELEAERVRASEVAADAQAEQRLQIRRDRQHDTQGGMRFFIPVFARDDRYALLVKIQVPAGLEPRRIGSLELKYKDRAYRRNAAEEVPLVVAYAKSDAASAATQSASVERTVQGHLAGEDLLAASERIARGDRDGAIALLAERAEILRRAAETLGEPAFVAEASRLTRLGAHAAGQGGAGEPRALALLFETAGRTRLQ